MSDPIDRDGLRANFWEKVPLKNLSAKEWEALCDGCGKCCLNKLEDEDSEEIAFTKIACRLLDGETCRCFHYGIRHQFVPDCVTLSPENIEKIAYWMPSTCAYRLLFEGKSLPDWHPLLTGTAQSVHDAGVSVQGWTVPEQEIPMDEWEDYIIEEPV